MEVLGSDHNNMADNNNSEPFLHSYVYYFQPQEVNKMLSYRFEPVRMERDTNSNKIFKCDAFVLFCFRGLTLEKLYIYLSAPDVTLNDEQ
jgi:hypothetical protein